LKKQKGSAPTPPLMLKKIPVECNRGILNLTKQKYEKKQFFSLGMENPRNTKIIKND
jgi:hypothetical protein